MSAKILADRKQCDDNKTCEGEYLYSTEVSKRIEDDFIKIHSEKCGNDKPFIYETSRILIGEHVTIQCPVCQCKVQISRY